MAETLNVDEARLVARVLAKLAKRGTKARSQLAPIAQPDIDARFAAYDAIATTRRLAAWLNEPADSDSMDALTRAVLTTPLRGMKGSYHFDVDEFMQVLKATRS